MVLQRYYGPRLQGGDVRYPKKVNKQELLDEYFLQATKRHGLRKGNVYFMTLYYQIYGKNNQLGLVYDNGWFTYRNEEGKRYSYPIDDVFMEKLVQSGVFERDKQLEIEEKEQRQVVEESTVTIPSAMDRFNRRMSRHKAMKEESGEREPGE